MEEWKEYKLGEIFDFNNGLSKGGKFFGHGYDFVSFKTVFKNHFLPNTLDDLVESSKKEREKFSVKEGDVFLTRTSETQNELAYSCVALKDYPNATYNGFTKRLRPNGKIKIDSIFSAYFFRSAIFRNQVTSMSNMVTRASLSNEMLDRMSIKIPSYDLQKTIGKILFSFDAKIQLNKRINDNLEQQAQALFKSWFVDFEPFKDGKFVESELGMIPEGCRVGKAEDFYNINIGKTPPRKEQVWFSSNSSDYIWVSISDLGSCGRFVLTSSELLTHEAIKKYNIILVPKDTILLSFKLTIGRVGIAGTELTTNEAIARFITSDKNREYTYFLLKGYNYEKLGSTSSIATAVNSKIIKAMVVLMPDKEILKAFSSLTKPYFDQILRNEQESIRLTILRDTLLPKQMSGELKINATEVL